MNIKRRAFRNQQRHPTHLAQFHADFHVGSEECVFKCKGVRIMSLDNFLKTNTHSEQACGEAQS